jgi:hypothetical protein
MTSTGSFVSLASVTACNHSPLAILYANRGAIAACAISGGEGCDRLRAVDRHQGIFADGRLCLDRMDAAPSRRIPSGAGGPVHSVRGREDALSPSLRSNDRRSIPVSRTSRALLHRRNRPRAPVVRARASCEMARLGDLRGARHRAGASGARLSHIHPLPEPGR